MSNIASLLKRLAKALATPQPTHQLDTMSLRQWADLPPHHPIIECAPASLPR